jgi:2-keto-4-pentenoate hydratase/2-oxohepta-3-ene-1,7-dioic acid hydratase in catechol pathway
MKYCTFRHGNKTGAGAILGSSVYDLGQTFFRAFHRPFKFPDLLAFLTAGGPAKLESLNLGALRRDRTVCMPLRDVRLLPPLPRPPKIICVGLNYKAHAAEQGAPLPKAPLLFAKAANTVIGPEDDILIPVGLSEQVDYEVELAAVIGTPGFRIPADRAMEHVFGFTVLNDVSARDAQFGDKQWFRGKSFHTFAPLGPVVVTREEIDPANTGLSITVNGETRQASNTNDLIFDVPALVAYISSCFPLETGDVISTGTPSGVGAFMNPPRWLKPGDRVEATVDGIGTLANTVR